MDQFLKCQNCLKLFNIQTNIPKVLPCTDLVCLDCLNKKSNLFLNEIFYDCLICNKTITIADPSDLPDNKLIMHHLLNKKDQSENLIFASLNIKLEHFTANKHFDQVINNIDLKTEFLILQLNNLRDSLIEKVEKQRTEFFSDLKQLITEETDIQNQALDIQKINNHNYLQASLYGLKKKLSIFEEINVNQDCLLGYVIDKSTNKNYFKIKNLKNSFRTKSTYKIELNSDNCLAEGSIRQYLLPLSRNKIIKIYFSLKRDLTLELFDQNGISIKLVKALDNMSSFPIVCTHEKYICISATGNVPNQDTFFSRFSHLILFDWDLNCVKKSQKSSMIESIFMNESNLLLTYSHRNGDICEILDYNLNTIGSFGQQVNTNDGFYFEKNENIYRSSQRELSFPKIFGFTEHYIYMYNKFQMIRMSRNSGSIENLMELNGEPCYFLLDKQKNIIKISGLAKRISFFNLEDNITITSSFSYNFDEIFISSDDYLVFCDSNKECVEFI